MQHDHPSLADAAPLANYAPVPQQRRRPDGWTAERQRLFLTVLAETGCISEACIQAGITARSAYRLRAHPKAAAFAAAWDQALRVATAKLLTLAYERAIRGAVREHWRDGKLISETRAPSDKLLSLLLTHLAPWNADAGTRWARLDTMAGSAAQKLAPGLATLEDSEVVADLLNDADFAPRPIDHEEVPLAPFDEDDAW
jgi:hypothetical protein